VIELDVHLPQDIDAAGVPPLIEQACAREELIAAMRGTLATYPGCIHWHFKRAGERGTLEVTWWPKNRKLWFKVADGREGSWIRGAMERLRDRLEKPQTSDQLG
jgi:hypothetical protein